MRISKNRLRQIIREELQLKESEILGSSLPQKPSKPIPLEDLQFVPGSAGDMPLPGIGAYKAVRNVEELEGWKSEFIKRYGPSMISWDYNGWHVDNAAFNSAVEKDRLLYMDYEQSHKQRYGKKPNLGT